MASFVPYIVKQGDFLEKIAQRRDCLPQDIWEAARNAELRSVRGEGHILCPGDLLWVPEKREKTAKVTAGNVNAFQAERPLTKITVALKTEGKPLAQEKVVVPALDPEKVLVTDGHGSLTLEVPLDLCELTFHLVDYDQTMTVAVGFLNPAAEPSGLLQRLQNLGFLDAVPGQAPETALAKAIASFQKQAGLAETGQMDDATMSALVDEHGC